MEGNAPLSPKFPNGISRLLSSLKTESPGTDPGFGKGGAAGWLHLRPSLPPLVRAGWAPPRTFPRPQSSDGSPLPAQRHVPSSLPLPCSPLSDASDAARLERTEQLRAPGTAEKAAAERGGEGREGGAFEPRGEGQGSLTCSADLQRSPRRLLGAVLCGPRGGPAAPCH